MRLWIRYLREKRITLLLYALTVLLFVAVGSLYHIENLGKLLYAALLTTSVWILAGTLDGMKYVRRSRQLEAVCRHFEESGELLDGEEEKALRSRADSVGTAESFEDAQAFFLAAVNGQRTKERLRWEERNAERGDYYLMWTHQIKTPIAAMRLLLNRLEFADREGFLLKEELFKIERYVEMVLAFQRLESISSDMVLQEYELGQLVRQVVKKDSILFINKGLGLELGKLDFHIVTDEKWFVFCLEQLLSNSIKYTAKGGISFCAEAEEKRVILSLKDSGIGIREEDLPRIFERGFTGYNGRVDKRSTGIGLYLCRRICVQLGITIEVRSEEGRGTTAALGIPGAETGDRYKQ